MDYTISLEFCNYFLISSRMKLLYSSLNMKKHITKKRLAVLSAIALLIIGAGYYFFFYEGGEKANPAYKEAEKSYSEREYAKALSQYKEAANDDPSFTQAYIQAANILLDKNQDDEAIEVLSKGIGFADEEALIYQKIGEIYAHNADFNKALENAEKAVAIDSSAQFRKDQVGYLALLGRYDEAKKKAQSIDGDDAYSKFLKAIVSYNDLAEAKDNATQAVRKSDEAKYTELKETLNALKETDETKISNYMGIAHIAIQYQEGHLTLIILDDIQAENEYYEGSYIYKAYVHMDYGDYKTANEFLSAAEMYAPNNADVPKLRAESYYEQSDIENAVKQIEKALSFAEIGGDTRLLAFMIYSANSDYTKALAQVEVMIKELPSSYTYNRLKAKALIGGEKYQEALSHIQTYLEEYGNELSEEQHAVMTALEGYSQYLLNDKKSAKENFDLAESLFPKNAEVNYLIGLFYKGQDDGLLAQEYFVQAVSLDLNGEIGPLAQQEISGE